MTAEDLLALFRTEMNDEAEPHLWSDELVYSYINDAQRMFCRLTDNIGDVSTQEVCRIDIAAGTEWYDTHPSILKHRACTRRDTGRPIDILNQEEMADRNMFFDGRSGPLSALIIGMEPHRIRVWPVPSEDVVIDLMVFRLPLRTISDTEVRLEIDEQHHEALLHWVKHRAYSVQDAEAFDKTKAAEFEQKFRSYCTVARDEQRRMRHKTRTVAYGGY